MSSGADRLRGPAARGAVPGRPAGRPRAAARADARQPDRAGAGRARRLGARGDARPAQLGPPRGGRGRRRQRRHGAGRAAGPRATPCAQAAVLEPARPRRAHAPATSREEARRILPEHGGRCAGIAARQPASVAAHRPLIASAHMAVCYRHPSRETGVSCSSCGRPICPDCMTPTPVGMRCPECSRERTQGHDACRSVRASAGGDAGADRDQRGRVPDRDGGAAPRSAVAAAARSGLTASCSGRR